MQTRDITIEIMTPAKALDILERNGIRRKQFKGREKEAINLYLADMSVNGWLFNGDAIIFDVNGVLINGRKRLLACAEAGVEFITLVVRNASPDAYNRIDQQRPRSEADAAAAAGFDNHKELAAMAASIIDIARTGLPSQMAFRNGSSLRFSIDNPGIQDVLLETKNSLIIKNKLMSPADLRALTFLTRLIDKAGSDRFIKHIESALVTNIPQPMRPATHFGNALLETQRECIKKNIKPGHSTIRYKLASYFIKAWNAERTNSPLKPLKDQPVVALATAERLHGLPTHAFDVYAISTRPADAWDGRIDPVILTELTHRIRFSIQVITPTRAAELLRNNGPKIKGLMTPRQKEDLFGGADNRGRNRKTSPTQIDSYAAEMGADAWFLTGESIKISKSGRLLDGQHRLRACIQSQTSFETLVVEGLDDEVFYTYDIAPNRTFSRILSQEGSQNAQAIQNALRHLYIYERFGLGATKTTNLSAAQFERLRSSWPNVDEVAAIVANGFRKRFDLPADLLTAVFTIMHRASPDTAIAFFDSLLVGAYLSKGQPVYTLRQFLDNTRPTEGDAKGSPWPRIHAICMGWNAYSSGGALRLPKLKDIHSMTAPEPFSIPTNPPPPKIPKRAKRSRLVLPQLDLRNGSGTRKQA